MRIRMNVSVLAAACALLPVASHAAEALNVKLGLWEVTALTETRGMPPLPKELLNKLTPEQRRKMEADIKAEQAKGPDKDTSRECITQKDLEQPFESANTKECKQTIVTTTRTSQEVRIACTGGMPGSGVFKVSAPSPERMNGTLDLTLGQGAESMTIKAQMQGRWLAADCGDEADDEDTSDTDSADEDADSP
jgi:hypothetical protein